MALGDLTSAGAVAQALDEFDTLGRDAFLRRYGFRRARSYFVLCNGRTYDSKAIAGAAHRFQHPQLGPMRAQDFSGGDATVRARLEALGFTVVTQPPLQAGLRPLELFGTYTRREVHDLFACDAPFTPGAGVWGLAGIIEYEASEFVLFVTFGREQGEHKFDEGITEDGVVTWQSQPRQTLADAQILRLIQHDSDRHNVRLFLRTRDKARGGTPMPYTYLGRLGYITHDAERERPVYFQWQIIDDWPPAALVLERTGLELFGTVNRETAQPALLPGLREVPPPRASARTGTKTSAFTVRKAPDWAARDAKNRALGLRGEQAVVAHEQQWLTANNRADLADRVRHVALLEGDGAGYDVLSFELDGTPRYIEVKTTCGGPETPFFVTTHEVEFSRRNGAQYLVYRVCAFNAEGGSGQYFVRRGPLLECPSLQIEAVQYRVRVFAAAEALK